MFIKSDIRKVTIALEKALGHEVYVRLGRAGIIHLGRLQTGEELKDAGIHTAEGTRRDILAGSGFVLDVLQIATGETSVPEETLDLQRDADDVLQAKRIVERLQCLRSRIQEKAAAVAVQLKYAEALSRMGIDPGVLKKTRLIRMVFGEVADNVPAMPADERFILAGTGRFMLGVAMPQAENQMIQSLKQYGFVDRTAQIKGVSLEILKRRATVLQRRLDVLDRYSDGLRKKIGPVMLKLYCSYKGDEEIMQAMRLSAFSAKAIFITGWMDARDKTRLISILQEICGERFMVADRRDPEAPVRLMNIRLFKPFELIVRIMGMPANREIDPTPLAALTFVIVFGLMFGDLGQGLVLALTGLVLKYIAKKKAKGDLVQAGGILIACGLSAAFCGLLYGSFFSSEHIIPALWIHPAQNIMDLFFATIMLGVVIITAGLCVNIINALINADYPEAFLDKRGMAILILYVAIVFFTVRYMSQHLAPASWEIGVFIFLPLVVFALRGVIGPLFFRAQRPHDVGEYVTETVMDIVEIALGMFANTISFIRVGAFAMAHGGLSIVTYTLAGMADPGLKSFAAIIILVVGNIFIIGFEGMICGIQSMRLEYYEFFSKFFKGDGVVFSPFVLKTKISEV